jgi:DNA-binding transcriptional LysR family regulator
VQGVLVEVLPRYRPEPMSLSLLYAHRRNLPKRVRVFMDWVAEILRPVLAH